MHPPTIEGNMTPYLPDDPLPGQVVEIPDGVDGGSVTHIMLHDGNVVLGEAQQLIKVENVSRKWQLGRTHTAFPLIPDTTIRVRAFTKYYASLIFVEYFGWSGHQYRKEEKVLSDRVYEILHTTTYTSIPDGPNIYELVCLHATDEGEINESA